MANPNLTAEEAERLRNPESRVLSKKIRQREEQANYRAVWKIIDKRDHGRCRACLTRSDPNAISMLDRAHRHHIIYRSAGGEDTDENLITLCAVCHANQHRGVIDIRGNARTGVELWKNDGEGGWYLEWRETMPFVYERD